MLHMVLIRHGPETCAVDHPHLGEKARRGFGQMETVSRKHSVSIHGVWGEPPAHTFYMPVDAPNAHVVSALVRELELFHWNTIDIRPVATLDEIMPLLAQA